MSTATVGRRLDRWAALRVALVLIWLAWAAMAWWAAPRSATVDDARAALAADRVVTIGWTNGMVGDEFWGVQTTTVYSSEGSILVYRTTDQRVHYVEVPFGPERTALVRELSGESLGGGVTTTWVGPVALLLVLIGLGVLIGGPAPVIGTRWYWFWMGGVPFGLGLLYWLAVERPWAAPASRPPDAKGRPRRRTGLTGFAFMILCGIALSILFAIVSAAVGDFVAPTR